MVDSFMRLLPSSVLTKPCRVHLLRRHNFGTSYGRLAIACVSLESSLIQVEIKVLLPDSIRSSHEYFLLWSIIVFNVRLSIFNKILPLYVHNHLIIHLVCALSWVLVIEKRKTPYFLWVLCWVHIHNIWLRFIIIHLTILIDTHVEHLIADRGSFPDRIIMAVF